MCFRTAISVSLLLSLQVGAQTSQPTIIVGALVHNYDGLEKGASGDLQGAKKDFEKALNYMPYFTRSQFNLQICEDALAGTTDTELAAKLFQALDHLAKADSLEALEIMDTLVKTPSHYGPTYAVRARVFEKLQRYEAALADYDQAIALAPQDPLLHFFRGRLKARQGESKAALSDLSHALTLDHTNAAAYLERGMIYCDREAFDLAINDFEEATESWPRWRKNFKIFVAYLNRGMSRNHRGEYALALQDLNEAIRLNAKFPEAYYQRALSYQGLESYGQAIRDLDHILGLQPDRAEAYEQRGLARLQLQEIEPAAIDLIRAIRLDEKYQRTIYDLGESYYGQKDYERLLQIMETLTEGEHSIYWAHYWRARASERIKQFALAITYYQDFLETAPANLSSHRAFAQERIGYLQSLPGIQ